MLVARFDLHRDTGVCGVNPLECSSVDLEHSGEEDSRCIPHPSPFACDVIPGPGVLDILWLGHRAQFIFSSLLRRSSSHTLAEIRFQPAATSFAFNLSSSSGVFVLNCSA